ncbi:MAG: DNA topoisomerase IB [Actinomycetota bacterium]|nr:DNA topoisomerase IB [Actinomycetota bacterium]
MPRLRRVDVAGPGIRRTRRGRGFEYVDEDGERIGDLETLERIRELAIPPAWEDVWICPYPNGHIQVVGTDAAGRKQYRYHQKWRERRDQIKFDKMIEFARALPKLRKQAAVDVDAKGFPRERVLACAVRLLDRGFFRIGGEEYAEENESFGLATMRKSHVKLGDDYTLTFDYPAKSGKRQVRSVVDPDVYEVVTALKARRSGPRDLLVYEADGTWFDVKSDDINAYIKEVTDGDFSAKDFRTWIGTVVAAVALAVSGEVAKSKTGRKRAITRAIEEVARYLGNTPAVARASYIDPRVFDRYSGGVTIGGVVPDLGGVGELGQPAFQGRVEEAVLDLLEEEQSPALEKVA